MAPSETCLPVLGEAKTAAFWELAGRSYKLQVHVTDPDSETRQTHEE